MTVGACLPAGDVGYWQMFAEAYVGVMQHFRGGGWYHDADIFTGQPTHIQFQSLQSFWPGEPLGLCCPAVL